MTIRDEAVNAILLNKLLSEHHKFPEQNRKLHEQEPAVQMSE